MNLQEEMYLLTVGKAEERPGALTAVKKLRDILSETSRPGRWTLRFFAAMVILTLIARGTSGAAMPRVSLVSPAQGTIVQEAKATAVISAGEGEELELPEGITVDTLYVSQGQTVKEGDPLVQLNLEELEDALKQAKVTLSKQEAQLAQLNASTQPDSSALSSAQQSLDRAQEDYDRSDEETRRAVEQAKSEQTRAEQTYEAALARWEELQAQTDPPVTADQLEAARQAMETAKTALTTAQQEVLNAQAAREDTLLSAKRSVENAQSALAQADTAYAQAQESAALTAQTNEAQAQEVMLEMEKTKESIQLLSEIVRTQGLVSADREGQVLQCSLSEGEPCPQKNSLRFSKEGSQLLAEFSLPTDQAEKLSPGQEITITQGDKTLQASVRRIDQTEEETSAIVAVLPQDSGGIKAGSAQASVVFSRNQYNSCVPVSAIRQDTQGSYVLTVEETQSAFGLQYQARRVPVTVLEVDSSGQYAAVEGNIEGGVITSSSGAVSPGTSVRYEE